MTTEPTPSLDALQADPRHRAARLKLALSKMLWEEIERQDMRITDVAERSGLSHQITRGYFAGEYLPTLDKLIALERGLGRLPGWIVQQLAEV